MSNEAKRKASKSPSVADLHKEIEQLKVALQHERADSINLSRRYEDQLTGLKTTLKATVVRELLPVIDNFERALKHTPKELTHNDYVKGVQGIVKQFEKTLQEMGVEKIKTVGHQFDPKYHEAVSVEESDGPLEVVCEELQAGYKMGEQVIRHAIVRVKNEHPNSKESKEQDKEE